MFGLTPSSLSLTFRPGIVNGTLTSFKEGLAGAMANRVHLLQSVRHKESMQEIVHDLIDEVVGLSDDSAPL